MDNTKGNTLKVTKDPEIDDDVIERINMLEARITQLETILKNTVTFETLAARLMNTQEFCKKRSENHMPTVY